MSDEVKSEKKLEEIVRKDITLFEKFLRNPNTELKRRAAYALRRLGEDDPLAVEKVVEPLLRSLDDEDDIVRATSVSALAALGDSMPDAIKPWIERFLNFWTVST